MTVRTASVLTWRKLASMAVGWALALVPFAYSYAGQALDRIRAKGVIVVATDPVWPPFSWRNANGRFEGFDIEVAEEIARRINVAPEYVTPEWSTLTAGGWSGQWDISVGSMTPTAERAKHLDFPIVYYSSPVAVAVHRDNTAIRAPADLSGKRMGILGDSTYELYLRRRPMDVLGMLPYAYNIDNPVILTYEQEDKVFDDLSLGDGVILDGMIN